MADVSEEKKEENRLKEESEEEDEDEDEDEEEREPELKYERIGNAISKLFADDSASCMAVHSKFLALGTHGGVVHVLDHQGNNIRNKEFPSHTTTVNQISIDNNGDYIASCSDDGRVVINGLYSSENNFQQSFDTPVKAVALDPEFSKKSTKPFVTGGDKLVLHEKGFFRYKSTVLHGGEGAISTIRWKSCYIAWANDMGVKVYDISLNQLITNIRREPNSPRPQLYRCNLFWKDNTTLIVGWANIVQVCNVKERIKNAVVQNPDHKFLPSKYVEIVAMTVLEYYICGIGPYGNDLIILSYVVDKNTNDGKSKATRPLVRIMHPEKYDELSEIIADALSVRGFENYSCNHYHLEPLPEESLFFIISPKDIVLAKPREIDDHIDWLVENKKFSEALISVEANQKILKRNNYLDIGRQYLRHLKSEGQYSEAARMCVKVLGNETSLWEDEVYNFAKNHQVHAIAPFIPRDPNDSNRLNSTIYEFVLGNFLQNNVEGFQQLVKEWPFELYNVKPVIAALKDKLLKDPKNPILLQCLGELYTSQGRYDQSLAIYLELKYDGVFELIHKHNLLDSIHDKIVMLMDFNTKKAVSMLVENIKKVSIEVVVRQLTPRPEYLYTYLDAVFQKDPELSMDFHEIQVPLYAEFDRPKLLPFLKRSNYYPLQKALNECKQRELIEEMVFLLGRMGNNKEALQLIIEKEADVEKAIVFAKEKDDEELWEDLITYSLDKPAFITGLLHNIGTHVDPIKLIKRIPSVMEIPGLRDSLVKILHDYNLQISLREGCKKILVKDSVSLMQRATRTRQKGVSITELSTCSSCQGSVLVLDTRQASQIVTFFCKHVFHMDCLAEKDQELHCQICTSRGQTKKTVRNQTRFLKTV
ncbi:vacuolar protein sorting-associated protein 41 homolog [Dendronephthya gigantea]|uniref:vacuolar protein sorting-associated protein 41 homolog n=1 Tax=Dendronephthya gigantea TaxID=151771 RepID=UPI00106D8E02|nr:vacuolar protein sorting-associated protein 41 homolog [Dendronephthya gigantea]